MRALITSVVFYLGLSIFTSTLLAQSDFSDLKADIINAETEAKRIEAIINIGTVYNRTQTDSIDQYIQELTSSNFENKELAQAGKQFLDALIQYHQGNLQVAVEQLEFARRYFNKESYKDIHLKVLNFLGIAYMRTNQVEMAIEVQNESIELCGDDPKYSAAKRSAYGNQANAYRRIGEYARAIYNLEKTLALAESDSVGIHGMSYLGLGQMLTSLNLYDRALDAYDNIDVENFPSKSVQGAIYSGKAQAFHALEELDSAYLYWNKAYEVSSTSRNWQQTLRPQLEMALISINRGTKEAAAMHIEIADDISSNYKYPPPAFVDLFITKIKYNVLIGELKKAKAIAAEFELFINDNSIAHLSKDGFRIVSELYEKLGDPQKALKYEKIHSNLDANPTKISSNARIAEQRSKLALLEKDEQIEQESAEKSFYQELTFQIIAITIVLIVVSIILYRYYRREKSENVIKDQELKDLKKKLNELSKKSARPEVVEHITLKSKALIKLKDLNYVSSDGPYLEFHLSTKENPEIDRNSLKNVLAELPARKFIQVHRSHIVNLDAVKSIYSNKVVLINGEELNVSRSYKDKLDLLLHNN